MRINYHHSEQTKAKIKASNLGKHHLKHTPEVIEKIRQASIDMWKREDYLEKMKIKCATLNEGNFKKGMIPWNKDKKLSEGRKGKEFYKGTRRRIKRDKCKWCGSTEKLEYDHITPIGKNGSNDDKNCQILCKKCNLLKRNIMDYPELYKNFNAKRANSANAEMPTPS